MRIEPTGELRQRQPRVYDEKHIRFIRKLPCAVLGCQGAPIHAAHIRAGALIWGKRPTGVGERPSDRWTVPLCGNHHVFGRNAQHRSGEEVAWFAKQGIDCFSLAHALYDASGDLESGILIVQRKMVAKVPF